MSRRKFEPHIILAKDKYGTRIFDGSTPEKATRALIKLFKERDSEGWYEFDKPNEELNWTKEKIEALPTKFQDQARKEARMYKIDSDLYAENVFFHTIAKSLAETVSEITDWETAYRTIYNWFDYRSNYEYEGVSIDFFENV